VPRRGLTVLAAVAFGAVASAAAHSEATSTQQKAFKNSKLESVYVLKGIVPRDESGAAAASQGLLEKTQMPSQFVPVGAVTDLSAIAARVAGSDLPTGEVVVGGMFVSAADNPGAAAGLLPRGEVAVTVSVSQAQGVAGLIQPGDRVDILLDLPGAQEATLYRSVAVLAVGTALQPTATAPPGSESQANAVAAATELITFAVSPAAAAHIAPAKSDSGGVVPGVYLALDAPGNAPASESTITIPGSGIVPGAATGSPAVTTTTTTLHKATPPSQGGGPGAPTP